MLGTRFLINKELWQGIQQRAKKARLVCAAVAYLGKGGGELLPLKKGDKLVVDLSMGAVKQGMTDPREVRRLRKRGVAVFSRGSLHAKFYLMDNVLIAGSANLSQHSHTSLDEAGVITADPSAVRRARAFFEKICTEPVREKYLDECVKAYRPPKFKPGIIQRPRRRGRRAIEAKLWFIGGLRYFDVPETERVIATEAQARARRLLAHPKSSVVYLHFASKPSYLAWISTEHRLPKNHSGWGHERRLLRSRSVCARAYENHWMSRTPTNCLSEWCADNQIVQCLNDVSYLPDGLSRPAGTACYRPIPEGVQEI